MVRLTYRFLLETEMVLIPDVSVRVRVRIRIRVKVRVRVRVGRSILWTPPQQVLQGASTVTRNTT